MRKRSTHISTTRRGAMDRNMPPCGRAHVLLRPCGIFLEINPRGLRCVILLVRFSGDGDGAGTFNVEGDDPGSGGGGFGFSGIGGNGGSGGGGGARARLSRAQERELKAV